ncbi:uncharacterized protein LOC144920678 [Branchiostoma floridae x Branchiostoma belcheri]
MYEGQRLVKKAKMPFLEAEYSFSPQSYLDMPSSPDDTANEVEDESKDEDGEDGDKVEEEQEEEEQEEEEEEVIIRVDSVDEMPDLEEESSAGASNMGSCALPTKPSPSVNMPEPQTPGRTRSDQSPCHTSTMTRSIIMSTPARTSRTYEAVRSVAMTPPTTPSITVESRNGNEPSSNTTPSSTSLLTSPATVSKIREDPNLKWKTKLGSALAVVRLPLQKKNVLSMQSTC